MMKCKKMLYVTLAAVVMTSSLPMLSVSHVKAQGSEITQFTELKDMNLDNIPIYNLGDRRTVHLGGYRDDQSGHVYFKIKVDDQESEYNDSDYYSVYSESINHAVGISLYDSTDLSHPIKIDDYFDNTKDGNSFAGEGRNFFFNYYFEEGKTYILDIDNYDTESADFTLCSSLGKIETEKIDESRTFIYNVINGEAIITGTIINKQSCSSDEEFDRLRESITSLNVPEKMGGYPVRGIDACAFQNLPKLKSLTLPKSLRYIEDSAITDTGLTSLRLPEGMTHLCENAIGSNEYLRDIYIPDSLTVFDNDNCFGQNNGSDNDATKITFHVSNRNQVARNYLLRTGITSKMITASMDSSTGDSGDGTNIPRKVVDHTLKTGANVVVNHNRYVVTDARSNQVAYVRPASQQAKKITVPSTITAAGEVYKVSSIKKSAFKKCKKVKTITIGSNVRSIGNYAFKGTKSLRKIVVKTSLLSKKTVKKHAFSGAGNSNKTLTVKVPRNSKKRYKKLLRRCGLRSRAKVR